MSVNLSHQQFSFEQEQNLRRVAQRGLEHVESIPQDTEDMTICIVGGAVRDALIPGAEENDLDFLVVGETVESMLDRGFHDINASSFGVLHDDSHEEWALARTETKPDDQHGYKGIVAQTVGVSLRDDLNRRDICMNAIALLINGGPPSSAQISPDRMMTIETAGGESVSYLIDPFHGVDDIKNWQIEHVSEAFSEDPIRVLRVARYASRYTSHGQFSILPETKTMMRKVAPELNRMSRDRLGEEVIKGMHQASNPVRYWDVLKDVGALAVIAPTLDRGSVVPAGSPVHHAEGDVYTHTMDVLEQMHMICSEQNITGMGKVRRYLMTIAHDLGKVQLADMQGGLWSDSPPTRFANHDIEGVEVANRLARRLGLEGHLNAAMTDAARHHMEIHDLVEWDQERLLKFVENHTTAPKETEPKYATVFELIDLAHADHQGRLVTDKEVDQDVHTEDDEEYELPPPEECERPSFNRDPFEDLVGQAIEALNQIDGYTALRTGLCESHQDEDVDEEELSRLLAECDACDTPGEWVGTEITQMQKELLPFR